VQRLCYLPGPANRQPSDNEFREIVHAHDHIAMRTLRFARAQRAWRENSPQRSHGPISGGHIQYYTSLFCHISLLC